MEFKKGYWNLNELEIQEWIDKKTKGFMTFDIKTLKEKIDKAINNEIHKTFENIEWDKRIGKILPEDFDKLKNNINNSVNKLFGFEDE